MRIHLLRCLASADHLRCVSAKELFGFVKGTMNMVRNLSRLGVAFLALLSASCAAQKGFDVTVTNRLSDPITVWMTKAKPVAGDKYEDGWMPPEVLAVGTTQRLGG